MQRSKGASKRKADPVEHFADFQRSVTPTPLDEDLHLMLVDIDAEPPADRPPELDFEEEECSEIRMFCVDNHEKTFLVHVRDFKTYFYVLLPPKLRGERDLTNFKSDLVKRLNEMFPDKPVVTGVELVEKASLTEFRHPSEGLLPFVKIWVCDHTKVSKLRERFARGFDLTDDIAFPAQTFESNIDYKLRFMVDKDLAGMSWLTVPAGAFRVVPSRERVSRCGAEIAVAHSALVVHAVDDKQWNRIAPLRIMSFDIECQNDQGFPLPERDQVITIGIACKTHLRKEPPRRVVLQLNSCDSIFDATLIACRTERELLAAFDEFVETYDPDILLGYNIIGFDLNYLVNRWNTVMHREPIFWGRYRERVTEARKAKFQSKVMGFRELIDINMEGRIQIDMLAHMMREKKLRSYSLNYVCYHFLSEQKEDVSYKIIGALQEGDSASRKRIATYCLKDAVLPLTLFEKLKCIYSYVEMARVTGVPINYILFKGQQVKVTSQLYRKTKHRDLLIPFQPRGKDEEAGYQGADVLEPKRGYYDIPIATLDFASLYPSIMISHNMCYSTLLRGNQYLPEGRGAQAGGARLTEEEVHRTPATYCFARKELRRGVLPEILEDLLSARKRAKAEMAEAQRELGGLPRGSAEALVVQRREELENLVHVLDGRQQAIKVSANSVYGFTGATVGALPCVEIASSVTSIGRSMIEKTKNFIISHYSPANGFADQADVIYGDTDSVMVHFGTRDISEAMRLGRDAADRLSDLYIKPIRLEFEKVYFPYLLLNKKRYAGLLWTRPEQPDRKDMKGVESVRRDNCLMVSTMVDKVLDIILTEKNIEKAKGYTQGMIADLLNNNIDISMLIITKGISRDGDDYKVKQPHVELVKRMRERNGEVKFNIGDRIPFVIVCGSKNSKNYERSEDPEYAFTENLPLDLNYYLEKQIRPPLERIFEVICDPREIFEGEHTRKVKQQNVSSNVGIGKFMAKSSDSCAVCKGPLVKADARRAVCGNCEDKESEAFVKRVMDLKAAETDFARLWSECQRCDGSLFNEVRCTNTDCAIFFKRLKMKKDAQASFAQFQKFAGN